MASLFADYFTQRPPFGVSEKKKSDFPDAMCLWQLEQYAKANSTIGIVASDDKGWEQYAAESETLCCAGSIDKEELSLGSLNVSTEEEVEIEVYLTCVKVHLEADPSDWNADIEIADGSYLLGGFEVEFDYGAPDDD